jgi:hypothetical protein
MSLSGVAFFCGLIGIASGIVWKLFNQRRIWVGKWKGKSVMIVAQGRTIRLLIDNKEVFVGQSWNKEGVFELQFQDVEQGACSGVMLVQNITSGEAQTFMADLILDGSAISLIQTPSGIFKQASLEQAEMIFRAKSAIKHAPAQNIKWDEVLNLCKDIRDVNQEDADLMRAVEVLQTQLRQNFDLMDRMERAMHSYEQLGGGDDSFDELHKKAQHQQENLLDLLKKLHTSVLSMQLTQTTPDNKGLEDILGRIHAEIEIEERLNPSQEEPEDMARDVSKDHKKQDKKKQANFIHQKTPKKL